MGTKSVRSLIVGMSLPMIASMLVQAVYNVVDSYFVSQINENAFAAVSLAFPIQYLMTGLAVGTAVGINALLSRSLGEKKFKQANDAAENGLLLGIFHYIIFLLFGLFFPRLFLKTQTQNQQIIEYGVQYISIVTIFSIGSFMQLTLERIFQSVGKTHYTMITQSCGMILNMILDPILIFGYFGMPELGVAGAAVATVIAQTFAAFLCAFLQYKHNDDIKITSLKPNFPIIKEIYRVGFPSFVLIAVTAGTIYLMNLILIGFSSTAVAALGAYFKIRSFIFLPIFGLNNAIVPVIAYNYGAGYKERVRESIRFSINFATGIMLFGFFVLQVFPEQLLDIFHASDELKEIGVIALRTISLVYLIAGHNLIASAVFQALGNGVLSLNASIIRQIVALLPVAYLISKSGNLDAVWLAYPISEIIDYLYCRHHLINFAYKKIDSIGVQEAL
jgi:putative MATE family efflux protein